MSSDSGIISSRELYELLSESTNVVSVKNSVSIIIEVCRVDT